MDTTITPSDIQNANVQLSEAEMTEIFQASQKPPSTIHSILTRENPPPSVHFHENKMGLCPLHIAAMKKQPQTLAYYLSKDSFSNLDANFTVTPLSENPRKLVENKLNKELASFNLSEVPQIPEKYKNQVAFGATDLGGASAIHFAVSITSLLCVHLLTTRDPTLLLSKTNSGDTPLHLAVARKDLTLTLYIVLSNPDALSIPNNSGWSPLAVACRSGWTSGVKTLISIFPKYKTSYLYSHVILSENISFIESFISWNPGMPKFVEPGTGYTLLHYSAITNNPVLITMLIEKYKCPFSWSNPPPKVQTPHSPIPDYPDLNHLLTAYKKKIFHLQMTETPIHIAIREHKPAAFVTLLVYYFLIHTRNSQGWISDYLSTNPQFPFKSLALFCATSFPDSSYKPRLSLFHTALISNSRSQLKLNTSQIPKQRKDAVFSVTVFILQYLASISEYISKSGNPTFYSNVAKSNPPNLENLSTLPIPICHLPTTKTIKHLGTPLSLEFSKIPLSKKVSLFSSRDTVSSISSIFIPMWLSDNQLCQFLSQYVDPFTLRDPHSKATPIHHCLFYDNLPLLKMLLSKSTVSKSFIDPGHLEKIFTLADGTNQTPWFKAVFQNSKNTVSWLLSQMAPSEIKKHVIDTHFDTVSSSWLHLAARSHSDVVFDILLKQVYFDNMFPRRSNDGVTPLHVAAYQGADKIVDCYLHSLITRPPTRSKEWKDHWHPCPDSTGLNGNGWSSLLDIVDKVGETPLHKAIFTEKISVVRSLLAVGASLLPETNPRAMLLPLHMAVSRGYENVVDTICARAASPISPKFQSLVFGNKELSDAPYLLKILTTKDHFGSWPRAHARLLQHSDILDSLDKYLVSAYVSVETETPELLTSFPLVRESNLDSIDGFTDLEQKMIKLRDATAAALTAEHGHDGHGHDGHGHAHDGHDTATSTSTSSIISDTGFQQAASSQAARVANFQGKKSITSVGSSGSAKTFDNISERLLNVLISREVTKSRKPHAD